MILLQSIYRKLVLLFGVLCMMPATLSQAHESRPAYLEINQERASVFDVTWRRPALGDNALPIMPVFPVHCAVQGGVANYLTDSAQVSRWTLQCSDPGLINQSIYIEGLAQTITDVLVRISFIDGATQTQILKPNAVNMMVQGAPGSWQVIIDYLLLGTDHILGGIDHLLFVLCLLLIVKNYVTLVKTITAFTVAHSITLAMATLGYASVPQAPVEAVIALSILFLAVELIKQQQGKSDLAMRAPWLVAFVFGLLHGFGFAGALSEVGLPQTEIPLALLMFNVGVEIGQLLFIAVVMIILQISINILKRPVAWVRPVVTYGIGSISAFWLIERISGF